MKIIINILSVAVFFLQNMLSQESVITHVSSHFQNTFGWDISVNNDYCAISDPRDSISANANGSINIYTRNGDNWLYLNTLYNENIQPYDFFGYRIKLNNNFLAVTSMGDNNLGFMAGAVHIYGLDNGLWKSIQTLRPDTFQEKAYFGESLYMSGSLLFIGAPGSKNKGAVYIYTLSNNSYTFLQKIENPYPLNMYFGKSIATTGDFLFIGAPATNMAVFNSTVFVYYRNGNKWEPYIQQPEINLGDDGYGSLYGISISAENNKLLIGAPHVNDKNGAGEEYFFAGKAYYYKLIADKWEKYTEFSNPEPSSHDLFGSNVAISDSVLFISCPRDDINETDEGALYLFKENNGNWQQETIKKLTSTPNLYFSKTFDVLNNILFVGTGNDKAGNNSGSVYYFDIRNVLNIKTIDKYGDKMVTISPNPARDKIFVTILKHTPYTLKLVASNGQIIISRKSRGNQEIKVSNLANGVYFISVNYDNQTFTQEIIVQH